MEIRVPELVSIVVFYVIILVLGVVAGWWTRRRSRGPQQEEMMIGGRRLGLWVGVMTITATSVGGGWINGTAEGVISMGLLNVQAIVCYPLGIMIVGLTFARTMHRRGYTTMLDPLQTSYGKTMGALLFLPPLCGDVFWAASILAALGATLRVIVGVHVTLSVIVSTLIIVVYTVIGGFFAVAYTDVIQLVFIFVGLWLAVPFALTHEAVDNIGHTWGTWQGHVATENVASYVDTVLLLLGGNFVFQAYYQRALAFERMTDLMISSVLGMLSQLSFAVPPVILGAVAASTDWKSINVTFNPEEDASIAVPLILSSLCPLGVTCVGLGAITAAVMSSADSCFLSSATMFTRNVYTALIRPKASERESVWVIRVSVLCVGAASATLALLTPSIYGLLVMSSDVNYVILFPQLLAALYLPWVNTYGSVISYLVAVFLRIAGGEPLLGIPPLIRYPFYSESDGQLFPYKTFAMVISLVCLLLFSGLARLMFVHWGVSLKLDVFGVFRKGSFEVQQTDESGVEEKVESEVKMAEL